MSKHLDQILKAKINSIQSNNLKSKESEIAAHEAQKLALAKFSDYAEALDKNILKGIIQTLEENQCISSPSRKTNGNRIIELSYVIDFKAVESPSIKMTLSPLSVTAYLLTLFSNAGEESIPMEYNSPVEVATLTIEKFIAQFIA